MLVRIAHKLIDEGNSEDGEVVLDAAHSIAARSLMGSVPEDAIMQSLRSLMIDNSLEFAIIGAVALMVHGQVRNTEDVDVLVSALPDAGKLRDPDYMQVHGFYRARSSTGTILTIDHRQNGQVELLVANSDLRSWALSTAIGTMVLGCSVPVVSAAALVALKIHAMTSNPSRKMKDQPDIVSILMKSKPDLTEAFKHLSDEETESLQKIVNSIVDYG